MKRVKIVYLRVDGLHVDFKAGANYIVGGNGSGKSTLFGYIKYALGLLGSQHGVHFEQVELAVDFSGETVYFKRLSGRSELVVWSFGREEVLYRSRSSELDAFFNEKLSLEYFLGSGRRSAFEVLDFCFLSDSHSVSRRQQWDALCAVCGVDNSFLEAFEKDIAELKMAVLKNKDLEVAVEGFSTLLVSIFEERALAGALDGLIEDAKNEFCREYRIKEKLFTDATLKYEEVKSLCDRHLNERVKLINEVFFEAMGQVDVSAWYFDGVEALVKGAGKNRTSYGEDIFLRFILVLVVAKLAVREEYNFPGFIVNDSYLPLHLDNNMYSNARKFLNGFISRGDDVQYIEFTYRDNVPKDQIVLNLDVKRDVRNHGWF